MNVPLIGFRDEEAWERLTDKDLKRTPSNGNSNENKENRKMPGNVHEWVPQILMYSYGEGIEGPSFSPRNLFSSD